MEQSKRTADGEINTDQGYWSACGDGNRLVEGHLSTPLTRRWIIIDEPYYELCMHYNLMTYDNAKNEGSENLAVI